MGGVHPVADLSERAQQREAPDRRVAAEVDLARRGEVAQVDAVRRKADNAVSECFISAATACIVPSGSSRSGSATPA
ncbi:MAG: hypothetical protein V8S81_00815 [Oscillospiraceae bacterium]